MKQRRTYIKPTVELLFVEQQELLANTTFVPGQTTNQGVYNDEGYLPGESL